MFTKRLPYLSKNLKDWVDKFNKTANIHRKEYNLKAETSFIDFVLKEWLVIVSGIGLVLTSLYIRRLPVYSVDEIQVLFLLFVLFVAVNGLNQSGVISKAAQSIERGRLVPLKLVAITFFLSMLVTNDIALIVIVPLTMSLNVNRKGILVVLEALAANSGSALTPVGNPQNLFIYWFYNVSPCTFIKTIAPFSLVFLVLLVIVSLSVRVRTVLQEYHHTDIGKYAYVYGALLVVILLSVFHILPLSAGGAVILFALVFDRKALRVDYPLLLSFLFFFGIADNLEVVLGSRITPSGHIFLFSALVSQVMSNVPAALLFANFTSNWKALLWGVNAGGFGSLFGSLANLIAYKIYVGNKNIDDVAGFTVKFLVLGYIAFFAAIGLYFLWYSL